MLSGAAGPRGEIALFDGLSLRGWHISAASTHSAPSDHRAGGDWRVVEGVIVGHQDSPGNGGLLVSDREFSAVEITLETADEWDSDSGLFLRTTPEGAAYQVTIDLYPGGSVGGIWGEALPKPLDIRRLVFGESSRQCARAA
jgi:3-keto-disaccharide hydrolase